MWSLHAGGYSWNMNGYARYALEQEQGQEQPQPASSRPQAGPCCASSATPAASHLRLQAKCILAKGGRHKCSVELPRSRHHQWVSLNREVWTSRQVGGYRVR